MSTILIGESELLRKHGIKGKDALVIGMLAALFHDVGIGVKGEGASAVKVTEQNIKDLIAGLAGEKAALEVSEEVKEALQRAKGCLPSSSKEWLEELRELAIAGRFDHARKSALLAEKILDENPNELVTPEIKDKILTIITNHDNPKIPVMDVVIEEELKKDTEYWGSQGISPGSVLARSVSSGYLFEPGDILLQLHHEADALWMVCEDGIEVDIDRYRYQKKPVPTHRDTFRNNVDCHLKEQEVYRLARSEDFASYGFTPDDGLYISNTGKMLFRAARERLSMVL